MKKLLIALAALSLAGCATQSPMMMRSHAVHVVAAPVVTVVPAAPVAPATFEMRWRNRIGGLRSHVHFFHHKKPKG